MQEEFNKNMQDLFNYYIGMFDCVTFDIENTKEIIQKGNDFQLTYSQSMRVRRKLKKYYA